MSCADRILKYEGKGWSLLRGILRKYHRCPESVSYLITDCILLCEDNCLICAEYLKAVDEAQQQSLLSHGLTASELSGVRWGGVEMTRL